MPATIFSPRTPYRDRNSSSKKFKCDFPGCNLKYYNRNHLRRHQKTIHGGLYERDKPSENAESAATSFVETESHDKSDELEMLNVVRTIEQGQNNCNDNVDSETELDQAEDNLTFGIREAEPDQAADAFSNYGMKEYEEE